jgi:WXG100 family type VII secretion target
MVKYIKGGIKMAANPNLIKVRPDEVIRIARAIDADIVRYTDSYLNVYRAVDEIRGHWRGRDNRAFNDQLQAFREALIRMETLLREYVSFLDRSAAEYSNTQDDVYSGAKALPIA